MKILNCSLAALALTASMFALQADTAEASSTSASAGTAVFGGDRACFNMNLGSMGNGCAGTTKLFEIPLTVDFPGNYTVTVRTTGSLQCTVYSTNSAGASSASATATVSGSGVFPSINVPTGGTLNVACAVPTNVAIINVNW
jgi:hypothetical protein